MKFTVSRTFPELPFSAQEWALSISMERGQLTLGRQCKERATSKSQLEQYQNTMKSQAFRRSELSAL
jgi:hypothetical protein